MKKSEKSKGNLGSQGGPPLTPYRFYQVYAETWSLAWTLMKCLYGPNIKLQTNKDRKLP